MEFEKKDIYLYLIAGKPRSGKNETASYIASYYQQKGKKTIHLQYSYYVKHYAHNILKWDGNEENKPRDFLNYVGVELIKDQIDSQFALRRMLEDIEVYSYFYDVITVSDVRFEEEIEVPKQKWEHTISIHITNPKTENYLDEKAKAHRTNHGLDHYHAYNYQILNDGDKQSLYKKLEKIMKEVDHNEH